MHEAVAAHVHRLDIFLGAHGESPQCSGIQYDRSLGVLPNSSHTPLRHATWEATKALQKAKADAGPFVIHLQEWRRDKDQMIQICFEGWTYRIQRSDPAFRDRV